MQTRTSGVIILSDSAEAFSGYGGAVKRLKRSALYRALVDIETWALIGLTILFVAGIIYGVMTEIDKIAKIGLNATHPIVTESIN